MEERLQKFLARSGVASRREAEKLITEGKVKVNGKTVTELGSKIDPTRDKVYIDNKHIKPEKPVYLLFHKPKGVVTTLSDPENRKTVADFLKGMSERLYPVGRLDYNTQGLLLLTNDGELMNALLHPKYEVHKTYLARLRGIPTEAELGRLREGIALEDGMTAPARARLVEQSPERNESRVEIIIHEGRNRQVRRMCSAIGHEVTALKRTEFAGLSLSGTARGHYRRLTDTELAHLKTLAGMRL